MVSVTVLRSRAVAAVLVLAGTLVACQLVAGLDESLGALTGQGDGGTDGDASASDGAPTGSDGAVDPDADTRPCDPDAPFVATPLLDLNTEGNGFTIRLSPDERTAYFASRRAGTANMYKIFSATRASRSDPFGPAELLATVDNDAGAGSPTVAADGLSLIFWRRVATSNFDLFVATRSSATGPFESVVALDSLNTPTNEYAPYLLASGAALYFESNRGSGFQLFRAANLGGGVFDEPVAVELDAGGLDSAVLSEDELTVFYGHWETKLEIWTARRSSPSAPFTDAHPVPELNVSAEQYPDWLSPDGCRMYLTSDRGSGGPGYYNFWVAERGK